MIILENYQNPKNRGLVADDSYKVINTNSESCIDQVDLQIKIEDRVIKDIRFDGEACAICTSSTSIMINNLIGKKIEDALNIIDNFEYYNNLFQNQKQAAAQDHREAKESLRRLNSEMRNNNPWEDSYSNWY